MQALQLLALEHKTDDSINLHTIQCLSEEFRMIPTPLPPHPNNGLQIGFEGLTSGQILPWQADMMMIHTA